MSHSPSFEKPKLGLCIMYPAPGVVERIGPDWDWVWIDGQHGELDYAAILSLVRACDLVDRPAFVRVPAQDTAWVGKALDTGAAGVIVPLVESAAEAAAMVAAAKFPPLGNRSYGGRRPIDRKGRGYANTANRETTLLVQIESPRASERAAEIAAVPGVDGLFLGLDDYVLRQGQGIESPKTWETVGEAYERVGKACRDHHKIFCAVGVGDASLRLCLRGGCTMIVAGGDVPFLANGSKVAREAANAILDSHEPAGLAGAGNLY